MKSKRLQSMSVLLLSMMATLAMGACGVLPDDTLEVARQRQALTPEEVKPVPIEDIDRLIHPHGEGGEANYGIGLYIDNIRDTGDWFFNDSSHILWSNTYCAGPAPGGAHPSISESFKGEISATVGISAKDVDVGVGFKYEETVTLTDNYEIKDIAPNTCRVVNVYGKFQGKSFEIWDRNYLSPSVKTGTGNVYRPIGFHWVVK